MEELKKDVGLAHPILSLTHSLQARFSGSAEGHRVILASRG